MCNIINMADLLIIVISEAPIKQKKFIFSAQFAAAQQRAEVLSKTCFG
jgi:hypothetical protein